MNQFFWITAALVLPLTASAEESSSLHSGSADKAAVHAQRRAAGAEAARSAEPGEGDPIPEPMAKVPRDERKAAGAARSVELKKENFAGELESPGEDGQAGNGIPAATPKVPPAERKAAGSARRAELTRENKAGQLREPGDNYPAK